MRKIDGSGVGSRARCPGDVGTAGRSPRRGWKHAFRGRLAAGLALLCGVCFSVEVAAKKPKRKASHKRASPNIVALRAADPVELFVLRRGGASTGDLSAFWAGSRAFVARGLRASRGAGPGWLWLNVAPVGPLDSTWTQGEAIRGRGHDRAAGGPGASGLRAVAGVVVDAPIDLDLATNGRARALAVFESAPGTVSTPPLQAQAPGRPSAPARPGDPDPWGERPSVPTEPASWAQRLEAAVDSGAHGGALLSAIVTRGGEHALWVSPRCVDCEVAEARGVIVAARGLSPAVVRAVATLAAGLGREATRLDEGLLELAEGLRAHWPAGIPVHSVGLRRTASGADQLELRIDFDAAGRAHLGLRAAYAEYQGEVMGPAALQRARMLHDGDPASARSEARTAARHFDRALAQRSRQPLWLVGKSESMALAHARNDAALTPLRRAIAAEPRALAIRRAAARVHLLRGERDAFNREVAAAIRLSPDDPETWALVRKAEAVLPDPR